MKTAFAVFAAAALMAGAASAGVLRSRVVQAAACGDLAPQAGGRLVLPSFDGAKVSLALGARAMSVTGHSSYGARSLGSRMRNATVMETPSGFVATVVDERTRRVTVFRWNGECLHVTERAPSGGIRRCATKKAPKVDDGGGTSTGSRKAASWSALTGNPLVDGRAMLSGETLTNVVDVLFAFDSSGASWVRTASSFAGEKDALGLFAEDRVANMNNILANSGLADKFSFRMAGTIAVSTDARSIRTTYGSADLDIITDYLAGMRTDYNTSREADWKRIRSKRKAIGADIVTFLVKSAESGTVGIGFTLDDLSIRQESFPDLAYNACSVSVAAYDGTIAHECGHNMGAGHAKMANKENSGPQLYSYSTGHYFNVTNAEGVVVDHCMTVMGYNDDGRSSAHAKSWKSYAQSHHVTVKGKKVRLMDSAYYDDNWRNGLYRETSHFSSPVVSCLYDDPVSDRTVDSGVPTGTASHDNARILSKTYPLVANYRLHRDALLVSCSGHGSVDGGGLYVPGKRAKLVATPKKGHVFCGWYSDAKMKKPLPGLWQASSYAYTVPAGGATVYAKFRAASSDVAQKLSIAADSVFYVLEPGTAQTIELGITAGCLPSVSASGLPDGMSLKRRSDGSWAIKGVPSTRGEWTVTVNVSTAARPKAVSIAFDMLVGEWSGPTAVAISPRLRGGTGKYETLAQGSTNEVTAGVKQKISISCAAISGESDPYVVEGLPPGLSCSGGAISGVPTKTGRFNVRVAPRKAWKWDGSAEFTLRVRALPAWAKGTFEGKAVCTNSLRAAVRRKGPAKLTVGSTGKISGKLMLTSGGTATFTFASYTGQTDGAFTAKGTAKVVKGGKTRKFAMTLDVSGDGTSPGKATLTMLGTSAKIADAFGWDVVNATLAKPK